jgi:hypothetical protein
MDRRTLPTSLVVVAVLFIIGGIYAVIEILIFFMHREININFGVLGLFIGPGLLRLSRGWRTCALVFIWIALIGVPIIALLLLATKGPLDFNVFGQTVGHVSKAAGLIVAGVVFVVALWEYRVLTRLDVRRLFGVGGA